MESTFPLAFFSFSAGTAGNGGGGGKCLEGWQRARHGRTTNVEIHYSSGGAQPWGISAGRSSVHGVLQPISGLGRLVLMCNWKRRNSVEPLAASVGKLLALLAKLEPLDETFPDVDDRLPGVDDVTLER